VPFAKREVTDDVGCDDCRLWEFYANRDYTGDLDSMPLNSGTYALVDGVDISNDDNWYHIVLVAESNLYVYYIDSIQQGNASLPSNTRTNEQIDVCHRRLDSGSSSSFFTGYIDEIGIWNRKLSVAEIEQLYNNGNGLSYDDFVNVVASMDIETDLNNTNNYNNLTLNYTFNGSCTNCVTDLANCSFYLNDLFDGFGEYNLSSNNHKTVWFNVTESLFNISFNCSNINASADSGYYYYRVDTIQPKIKSDFVNNTVFNVSDNFRLYVNFTDSNLFAYNISFLLQDGNPWTVDNIFAENLTVDFAENLTTKTLISSDIATNATIKIQVWDSHTKSAIKNYKIDKLQNGVEINDKLRIKGEFEKFNLIKEHDRYSFDIVFKNQSYEQTISLSNKNLRYLPESSQYKGHFVLLENKGGYWIDFASSNIDKIDVKKTKTGYDVVLRFKKKTKKEKFKSIGDLNYNEKIFVFTVQDKPSLSDVYLQRIDNTLKQIQKDIDMIWIIMLYLGLISISYWMIITHNIMFGTMMMMSTIGLDFYIMNEFLSGLLQLSSDSPQYIVFAYYGTVIGAVVWIFLKLGMMALIKVRFRGYKQE